MLLVVNIREQLSNLVIYDNCLILVNKICVSGCRFSCNWKIIAFVYSRFIDISECYLLAMH